MLVTLISSQSKAYFDNTGTSFKNILPQHISRCHTISLKELIFDGNFISIKKSSTPHILCIIPRGQLAGDRLDTTHGGYFRPDSIAIESTCAHYSFKYGSLYTELRSDFLVCSFYLNSKYVKNAAGLCKMINSMVFQSDLLDYFQFVPNNNRIALFIKCYIVFKKDFLKFCGFEVGSNDLRSIHELSNLLRTVAHPHLDSLKSVPEMSENEVFDHFQIVKNSEQFFTRDIGGYINARKEVDVSIGSEHSTSPSEPLSKKHPSAVFVIVLLTSNS